MIDICIVFLLILQTDSQKYQFEIRVLLNKKIRGKLFCVILGIIIVAAALCFSTMLWDSNRTVALIISVLGSLLGCKIMMI